MNLVQLMAVFGILFALLAAIAIALARRTLRRREGPRRAAPKAAQTSKAVTSPRPDQSAPQARKRRLVTDFAISNDPLAAKREPPKQFATCAEVEQRLEDAFNKLEAGEVSLDTYRALVRQEENRIAEDMARVPTIEGESGRQTLEELRRAMALIEYCLDWSSGDQGPPRPTPPAM